MKVKENNILNLIYGKDKKFIVPVYQRPYSWKKKNCEQLLKDLKVVYEHESESHFFGSLVYVSENNGKCQEFIIIDGQQRIITVSLLLLAIYNFLLEHPDIKINSKDVEDATKIKNTYLMDENVNDVKKLKLKLIQGDDAAYDALIERNRPIENTCITINYKYFYSEIKKMTLEELEGIYNAMGKLDIVSISLQPHKGDDPQLIFESLNSTGLDLETADKIRNYILMNINHEEQEKFYINYWESLEKLVGRYDINKFIRYYLAIKTRKLYDEKKLYFEFKYYREGSQCSIDVILKDMIEYAGYYRSIVNPKQEKTAYSDILERINKLNMKTCIPLIMDLFKAETNGYITKEKLNKALEVIENFIVRREICSLPTNIFNKLFVQIGAEVDKEIKNNNMDYYDVFCYKLLSKTGKSRFPNNHDFREHFASYDLYNAKSSMKKYILERLENFGNKELVAVEKLIDEKKLTIEHVMPQTLSDEWKQQLGTNWEIIKEKYLNTIGNLTLTAYNSNYSNLSFQKKKTMKEKGFLFSKLFLNDYIKGCNEWGEKEIKKRADILYKKAEKIWWIPEVVEDNEIEKTEWINWDEDVDLTNKKILQVEVMGTLMETKDMSDAYRKIHKSLFELEPIIYYKLNFAWFNQTKEGMRRPYELSESAYIETNKSNQSKFNSIKKIAEAMQLDSNNIRLLMINKKI